MIPSHGNIYVHRYLVQLALIQSVLFLIMLVKGARREHNKTLVMLLLVSLLSRFCFGGCEGGWLMVPVYHAVRLVDIINHTRPYEVSYFTAEFFVFFQDGACLGRAIREGLVQKSNPCGFRRN